MKKKSVKKIVGEFLDSSDQSSHQFRRLYNIAARGMEEFTMDITGTFKTVVLDVSANKTVALPCDYVNYSKIGVINDKGEIATFKRNDQLSNYNAGIDYINNRSQGAPTIESIGNWVNPTSFPFLYYNYWSSGISYNLFGLNSGTAQIGSYKLDEENGVILLGTNTDYAQIVLEYLSDGLDEAECDYFVDFRASEAFLCYIRWKNATDLRKKFTQTEIREYKREYYRERKLAKMRINRVIISELTDKKRALTKLVARA